MGIWEWKRQQREGKRAGAKLIFIIFNLHMLSPGGRRLHKKPVFRGVAPMEDDGPTTSQRARLFGRCPTGRRRPYSRTTGNANTGPPSPSPLLTLVPSWLCHLGTTDMPGPQKRQGGILTHNCSRLLSQDHDGV